LVGNVAAEQFDQCGEQPVEFVTYGCDVGVAVTGEQQAGLVDREFGVAVGVGIQQSAQRCVEMADGSWRNMCSAIVWLPMRYAVEFHVDGDNAIVCVTSVVA
jgi:hypothetical protein